MTLDNYIERLEKLKEEYGGDIKIVKTSENYELLRNIVDVKESSGLHLINVKKESKQFRDDFDFYYYNADVYIPCKEDEEGAEKVIFLY